MTTTEAIWMKEFGLEDRKPPHFFSSVDQLEGAVGTVPQVLGLRRAFEQLGISGVLCQDRSGPDAGLQPIVYFYQVDKIDPTNILKLHRSFWNQGIAPILVIIAPDDVHIYSGLTPPTYISPESQGVPGLVETINRAQDALKAFVLSVESGEFFRVHRRSFDPSKRVDRELLSNLKSTRRALSLVEAAPLDPQTLDTLLCRMVFTCYLFDRRIIDHGYLEAIQVHDVNHLRDLLTKMPPTQAKADLYKLFNQLANDFNGDLFSADLEKECQQIGNEHLAILNDFFQGTDIQSGQQAFWPYDFGYIPIETISAIYEDFLKSAGEAQKKETGAFYTPRFVAEFVLDVALEGETSLLDKKYLDPACGSGVFLVGLFNRLAEEWTLRHPGAPYNLRTNGLMDILRTNLYGIDSNPSACQITAFSLYLAFLDQLAPPDIRRLLGQWDRLPRLVSIPGETDADLSTETIRCADFFTEAAAIPEKVHIIVGNPPWGSVKDRSKPAVRWCAERNMPHPDLQLAIAFVWKAPSHLTDGGRVCFLLPHGVLFNHNTTAIRFQQSLFLRHAVDRVINLTDFQFFLFEESRAPALVIRYRKDEPADGSQIVEYWAPKTDWAITQAEIMTILPQDRSQITLRQILDDLKGQDAPLIWKTRLWATQRDRSLLDRLSLMPRLRESVRQPGQNSEKRWLIAEGFQPLGQNDDPTKAHTLDLPSQLFIAAKEQSLSLVLLKDDCEILPSSQVVVRERSNRTTDVFRSPHVLVTKGFSRVAYADFDVSFRHALRGIHGPKSDRDLLIFMAAYFRTDLARYFLFHTSSNWGVSRAEVHIDELLRLPFPLPDNTSNPTRARSIIREIAAAVTRAIEEVTTDSANRTAVVYRTQEFVGNLIEEYFDINEMERMLIADTTKVIIPSVRPSRSRPNVPTIKHSSKLLRASYTKLLCDRLNGWAQQNYMVHAATLADPLIGMGMVILEKTKRGEKPNNLPPTDGELLRTIESLQRVAVMNRVTYDLARGLKVFYRNLLYIPKPLGQRFWTNTAALNDADEIAATILMRPDPEGKWQ